MKIKLVCVEDGIIALGFRKMTASIKRYNADTHTYYAPLARRSMLRRVTAAEHEREADPFALEIAREITDADVVAFSSMSDYSHFVEGIIAELRRMNSSAFIVWGGVHPIIVPQHAVRHADAVCTGEGEFAFRELWEKLEAGRDPSDTKNFWFKRDGEILRNGFLPLMTSDEMSAQPYLEYANGEELIFDRRRRAFRPLTRNDYLMFNNLAYNTIWSLGCPFQCTYCGNTKFIANDRNYRKLRYLNVDHMMAEIERAVKIHPHISSVLFHDDSFMALPRRTLIEFAEAYKKRVDLPFCVFGVIPNYVKDDKFDVLLDAGMNRIRMGIQSGSERILEFYKRPSPPERIMAAATTIARYTPYMIPPAYDIIVDNPIETKEDVDATLDLLYEMPRPFTLNLLSLRLMPNTELEEQFKDLDIRPEDMAEGYFTLAPTLANVLAYMLAAFRPPRFVFEWFKRRAKPFHQEQPLYPRLALFFRFVWFGRRGFDHLRNMDFAHTPGMAGFVLYKLGVIRFWKKHVVKKYESKSFEHRWKPAVPSASATGPAIAD